MSDRPTTVEICDVGPRDGLQNLGRHFSVDERVALIDRLSAAGLRRIEAVSFVNPKRVPQMAGAEDVLARIARPQGVRFSGLVMNRRGVERALATRLDEIRYVLVASETMSERNQGASMAENVSAFLDVAKEVRESGRVLSAVIAVAFGCSYEGEVSPQTVVDLAEAAMTGGADEVILADTIGVGVPVQVTDLASRIKPVCQGRPFGFHFHNTRNTGYANAYAAVGAGASVLDSSIGGIGGCPFAPGATGNIATEDLIYLLERSAVDTRVDPDRLIDAVKWLETLIPDDVTGQLARAGLFPGDRTTRNSQTAKQKVATA